MRSLKMFAICFLVIAICGNQKVNATLENCGDYYAPTVNDFRFDYKNSKLFVRSVRSNRLIWTYTNVVLFCNFVETEYGYRSVGALATKSGFLIVRKNNQVDLINWLNGKVTWSNKFKSQPYLTIYYVFDSNLFVVSDRYVFNIESRSRWIFPDNSSTGGTRGSITGSMPGYVIFEYSSSGGRMIQSADILDAASGKIQMDLEGRHLVNITQGVAFFRTDQMYDSAIGPQNLFIGWFNSKNKTTGDISPEYSRMREGCHLSLDELDGKGTIQKIEYSMVSIDIKYKDCFGEYWMKYRLEDPKNPSIRIISP